MFTCKTMAVTHRKLCTRPFLEQIGRVLAQQPAGLILREKDLSWEDYAALAKQVIPLCQKAGVPCYLNGFPQAGTELGHPYLQFSFPLLTEFGRPRGIQQLGVSVHSVEQAVRAQQDVTRIYADPRRFTNMSPVNIAKSGLFSADRAVREYADHIWNLK